MARYQVMFWKHIPAHVKAWDERDEVKRLLPDRFQAAIDAYAMKDGSTDMDAYLEGWRWSETQERPGSPEDVASAVVTELDAANPRSVLMNPEKA
jgi:hypothetical protein